MAAYRDGRTEPLGIRRRLTVPGERVYADAAGDRNVEGRGERQDIDNHQDRARATKLGCAGETPLEARAAAGLRGGVSAAVPRRIRGSAHRPITLTLDHAAPEGAT